MKKDIDWVYDFVQKVEASDVTVEIKTFVVDNMPTLQRIGMYGTKRMLRLLAEGQTEEAFNTLLTSMSPEEMIRRMNANADSLKQDTAAREKFWADLQSILLSAASKLAIKLLLPMLPI